MPHRKKNESDEEYRKRNREYHREYRKNNPERCHKIARKCYRKLMEDPNKRKTRSANWWSKVKSNPILYKRAKEYQRWWINKKRKELRKQFIEFKGGKCQRCGNTDERTFEIHHINGRNEFEGRNIYITLRKVDWSELQLLCANCHRIKTQLNN